jgi:hypothetical protein
VNTPIGYHFNATLATTTGSCAAFACTYQECCSQNALCKESNCGFGLSLYGRLDPCFNKVCATDTSECCQLNNYCSPDDCGVGFYRKKYELGLFFCSGVTFVRPVHMRISQINYATHCLYS